MIQAPLSTFQSSILCQTLFSCITVTKNLQTQAQSIIKTSKNPRTNSLALQYQILQKMQSYEGFPRILSSTMISCPNPTQIQLQRLGPSLKTLIINSNRTGISIPIESIIRFSFQMIDRVQMLHDNGYIHMDLKPQHFLFEEQQNPQSCLYLIDFGMAVKIGEGQEDGEMAGVGGRFRGSLVYASVNSMKCKKPSIRDDLQSLLYIIGELLQGQLPWKPYSQHKQEQKNWKSLYSRCLISKQHGQGWTRYKNWMKQSLNKIRTSQNAYMGLRKNICKLMQLQTY